MHRRHLQPRRLGSSGNDRPAQQSPDLGLLQATTTASSPVNPYYLRTVKKTKLLPPRTDLCPGVVVFSLLVGPHPSTLLLDTTIPWPVKRSRGFTGGYVKPTTTSSRNAAPPTPHETEKSAPTDVNLSPVTRVPHGSHPRAAGTYDGGSPTDTSPNQPDTKKCIQVGRDTYGVQSQPRTSYDSIPVIDSSSPSAPKQNHTKKRKPNRHTNRHHSRDDRHRHTRK